MSAIWTELEERHRATSARRIASLFDDPDRFDRFSAETDDLLLDVSKTNIDDEALALLISLADSAGLADRRDAMFRGDKTNTAENRAVLHTALRSPETAPLVVDGVDVRPAVTETLDRMERFARAVRSGDAGQQRG